jgi:hypothetical protein
MLPVGAHEVARSLRSPDGTISAVYTICLSGSHSPDSRCEPNPVAMRQFRVETPYPAVDKGDLHLPCVNSRSFGKIADGLAFVQLIGESASVIARTFICQGRKASHVYFHDKFLCMPCFEFRFPAPEPVIASQASCCSKILQARLSGAIIRANENKNSGMEKNNPTKGNTRAPKNPSASAKGSVISPTVRRDNFSVSQFVLFMSILLVFAVALKDE